MKTISGPDLVEIITGVPQTGGSDGRVGPLDADRWGRYLPPHLRRLGPGRKRRITEREAAICWAAVEFAGGEQGGDGRRQRHLSAAAANIAAYLHGCETLPAYVAWTAEGRFLSTDDPAQVVATATKEKGARVICLTGYVDRVRALASLR